MSHARSAQRIFFEEVETVIESRQVDKSWVDAELRSSALPDERLNKRFKRLTATIAHHQIPAN